MAKLLKLRRGTTTQHGSFTGAEGEVTIDTTKDTAVVHDGSTQAGRPLAREDMSNVSSASIAGRLGTDSIATSKIAGGALPTDVTIQRDNITSSSIRNSEVHASAAIAGTKISPDFGSQNITTTGAIASGDIEITGTAPSLVLQDSDNENDFAVKNKDGTFGIRDVDAGVDRFKIQSNGQVICAGNLAADAGIGVTGNISVSGTVDGRDVAADGTKLDGIESGATADQSAAEILTAIKTVDGSGSGLDADHLDGRTWNEAASTNSIVSRTSSGYIFANFFNTTANDVSSGVTKVMVETGNDNYIRHGDAGSIRSFLNVENGATADQTKSDIDGLNINADQVDGLHASSFVRTDANSTINSDLFVNGGTGALTVNGGSDIRLNGGTWTGNQTCKIQHHSDHLYVQYPDSGTFRVRDSAGNDNFTVDSSGNAVAAGNVTAYSDVRLKTDIHTINDALGICGKLRGVSYKWIRDGKPSIGVIAQEVEEVIPEVVLTSHDVDPSTGEVEEIKSVDYGKIVGVLINAINELKAEVDELKGGK